jgi:hypothetical protein
MIKKYPIKNKREGKFDRQRLIFLKGVRSEKHDQREIIQPNSPRITPSGSKLPLREGAFIASSTRPDPSDRKASLKEISVECRTLISR